MLNALISLVWKILLVVGIILTTIKLVKLINDIEEEHDSMDFLYNDPVTIFPVSIPSAIIVRI